MKAQLAVQRHRAGLVDDGANADATPDAGRQTPPSPPTPAASGNGGPGQDNEDASLQPQPPAPVLLSLSLQEGPRGRGGDGGAEGAVGAADGGVGGQHEEGGAVEWKDKDKDQDQHHDQDFRKTEEAEALASQLQIIAMHLVSCFVSICFVGDGRCGSARRLWRPTPVGDILSQGWKATRLVSFNNSVTNLLACVFNPIVTHHGFPSDAPPPPFPCFRSSLPLPALSCSCTRRANNAGSGDWSVRSLLCFRSAQN